MIAVAVLVSPIAIALADYAGVLLYESAHSTSGTFSKYQEQRLDHTLDLLKELRGTRWENNPDMAFAHARNCEHLKAIAADLEWQQDNRMQLCASRWRDWRPAMLIMRAECWELRNEQMRRRPKEETAKSKRAHEEYRAKKFAECMPDAAEHARCKLLVQRFEAMAPMERVLTHPGDFYQCREKLSRVERC